MKLYNLFLCKTIHCLKLEYNKLLSYDNVYILKYDEAVFEDEATTSFTELYFDHVANSDELAKMTGLKKINSVGYSKFGLLHRQQFGIAVKSTDGVDTPTYLAVEIDIPQEWKHAIEMLEEMKNESQE